VPASSKAGLVQDAKVTITASPAWSSTLVDALWFLVSLGLIGLAIWWGLG
jgi:hypothetical protein